MRSYNLFHESNPTISFSFVGAETMAPNLHIKKAFMAMRAMGIEDARVKPVLKNLLALYEKNWELIAEDNYRVLADAIFDSHEDQVSFFVLSLIYCFFFCKSVVIIVFVITLTFHIDLLI